MQPENKKAQAIDGMTWPDIRAKIGGAHFVRWPGNMGFSVDLRNWYYGYFLRIDFGRFGFMMGRGVYE